MKRLPRVALLCLALSFSLAGCKNDLFSSGDKGFVSGGSDVTIVPAKDRLAPKPINGTTLDGDTISLSDFKGKIVVMPVWGSWCGPCRAEGPMLAAAAKDLARKKVAFLGINSRDNSADNALAFQRNFKLGYPSLYNPSGSQLLNFQAGLTPNTIPSVAFIDADGRVAAAVLGEISRATLYGVIEDLQK
jgi:thiol-disulfide isomerase/thioredoxin